jgi:PhnB protein
VDRTYAAQQSEGTRARCRFLAGPFDYLSERIDEIQRFAVGGAGARLSSSPEMTMKMYTYVNFAGKCAEAFRFYEKNLGAKIGMMMTHGQAPDQSKVDPAWKDAVLHARLSIAGTELLGADIPSAQPMRSAYLSLSVESDAEAERIFSALSEGGEVFMPMEDTFFASRFGQLRDRFGLNWMILHERPMPPRT